LSTRQIALRYMLRRAYKDGGKDALVKAWADLYRKNFDKIIRVACAFDPDHMQRIRDAVKTLVTPLKNWSLAKKK
jgi:hypothetical protein